MKFGVFLPISVATSLSGKREKLAFARPVTYLSRHTAAEEMFEWPG
jgi:hypothetical protein